MNSMDDGSNEFLQTSKKLQYQQINTHTAPQICQKIKQQAARQAQSSSLRLRKML